MSVVSVIVPVYNAEKYLENCIESIINQSMREIEIILVNDGSTDDSEKICKQYERKDARVRYIEQKNQGVSVARNKGKDIATGEYILFIDADDEMDLTMIEKLYSDIQKYNGDIAVCKIQKIKSKDEVENITVEDISVCSMVQEDALKSYFTESKLEIGVWNKLFKKSVIENVNYYVGRRMNEDKFFAFESILNAQVITYRNEGLYYYYERNNSVTKQKFDEKWFDNIFFAEKIYEIIIKNKPNLEREARHQLIMTKYYLLLAMKRKQADRCYKEQYEKVIDDIKQTKINDLKIRRNPKVGMMMIKYCRGIFEITKSITK